MDRTADLEAALSFAVQRIGEQARASGHPLNEEEDLLLRNLPSSNVNYPIRISGPPKLVPRNTNLERLCALARAAYENDRRVNPMSRDWEFAFSVFALNRNPMWGVLHAAGVEMTRRPLSDQCFLIVAAVLPVMGVMLFVWNGPATLIRGMGIFGGMIATMLFIYFGSRRMENQRLENHLERCRLASPNIRWKTS